MTKTITCSDTVAEGGCDATFTAETMEDAKSQLGAHAAQAHADMMKDSTEEDMAKWNTNFETNVWPNAPENN